MTHPEHPASAGDSSKTDTVAQPATGIRDARVNDVFAGSPTFALRNRLYRALWGVSWLLLCRWTPAPAHAWRAQVLRWFGARIGRGVFVYPTVRIWSPANLEMLDAATLGPEVNCYSMARITLGRKAIASQRVHLCAGTHDVDDPSFQLIAKPIAIGDNAWIAAEAFVGPGVIVGEGAVLGARGVTVKNLEPWTIYAGNPARIIRQRKRAR